MALSLSSPVESMTLLRAAPATRVEHVTATRLSLVHSGAGTLRAHSSERLTLRSRNVDAMTAAEILTPVFTAVTIEPAETEITCSCTTDRLARVRYRARPVSGGSYIVTAWELLNETSPHSNLIQGLTRSVAYYLEIEINARTGLDLGWSAFTDGITGPIAVTV